jgi:hypothetical protein
VSPRASRTSHQKRAAFLIQWRSFHSTEFCDWTCPMSTQYVQIRNAWRLHY